MSAPREDERVRAAIARLLQVPVDRIVDEQPLAHLVAESLMLVRLVLDLEELLGIAIAPDDVARLQTVGDLVRGCLAQNARPSLQ